MGTAVVAVAVLDTEVAWMTDGSGAANVTVGAGAGAPADHVLHRISLSAPARWATSIL